ncbi:MAG: hypothetical protein ACTSYD_10625 [Candidatus Heimdallarchaeaceae archaeon]
MSIQRPDAYICNACGHRFNDEEKEVMREQIDGIYTTKIVCPKCKSPDIRTTIIGKK